MLTKQWPAHHGFMLNSRQPLAALFQLPIIRPSITVS
jgi:hypothetical protein